MVSVLPSRERPSISQRFSRAVGKGLDLGSQMMMAQEQKKAQEMQLQQENEAGKRLGIDLAGISDPKMRQQALQYTLQAQNDRAKQAQQLQGNYEQDQQRFETIKRLYGDDAAELYKTAPEGGKTQIVQALIEGGQRGLDLNESLGLRNKPTGSAEAEKSPIKTIDFDKGLTPKERVRRGEERYAKNLPLFQEAQKKMNALDMEAEELDILNELSPQISGIERLNINPSTGELLIPGLASPEAQRFAKTVNDFTTRAKDSYGARVTNFDLNQFMKRLPTLANSEEGRRQILQQMQALNGINRANEKALSNVIEEYGGIRNIDYDKAEQMAAKIAKPEVDAFKREFKKIGTQQERSYEKVIEEKKKNVPKGYVLMEVNGEFGYVPRNQAKEAIENGAKAL